MFVIEAVFIPQSVTKYRYRVLLENADKFSTKLSDFSCMIFAVRACSFGKFHNHTVWL